jgi:hypothetical protein
MIVEIGFTGIECNLEGGFVAARRQWVEREQVHWRVALARRSRFRKRH